MKNVLCLFLMLFGGFKLAAQEDNWFVNLKQLQKHPATQSDVEKLFITIKVKYSTPIEEIERSKSKIKLINYELPEGDLRVLYSAGKCSAENTEGFDFSDGVIITYDFTLRNLVPISDLKIKLGSFPKVGKADDTEHRFYSNPDKGVTYTVLGEKLQNIKYFFPTADEFACKKILKRQPIK